MTFHKAGSFIFTLLAAACVFAQTPAPVAATSGNPEKTRAEYNVIASHLDTGGDLMVIANTDGVAEEVAGNLRAFAKEMPLDLNCPALVQAMDRLPAFVQSSGLNACQGFGLSIVPRPDGLNDLKGFICRDPAAAQLPLWLGLVGGAPKHPATLDYLPADTVLARACTGEPRQFWTFIVSAVRQVGGPEVGAKFDQAVKSAGGIIGTNLDSVIGSMDAEQFFSLQLSSTQTMQLPQTDTNAGAQAVSIAVPSLLAGCAVHDATLVQTLQHVLQKNKISVITSACGATTLYTVNIPLPLPFPVAPTFAVHRNMFLFGSTAEIVRDAVIAAEAAHSPRLPGNIQKAFAGLPIMQNNGFAFVDPRFSETVQKVQAYLMKEQGDMFSKMMQRQPPGQLAAVILNEKDGISIRGTTSANGRHVVLGMAVMPVAVLSAVAIPSFLKSRNAARHSACINNLRLIDHAKEQWATIYNKTEKDTPTEKDLVPFLGHMKFPVCPDGGIYQINAVGEPPTCSHPGHALPKF